MPHAERHTDGSFPSGSIHRRRFLRCHTALSGYTNVRLDNYIHTVESFRSCRRLLAPGGALYVSYWATQDWVATRLEENLRRAFGEPPVSYFWPNDEGVLQTHYTASDDPAVRTAAAGCGVGGWRPEDDVPPRPSTDDWPYLFVYRGIPPTPMLLLAVPLLGFCLVMVAALVRLGERGMAGEPLDRHFFFLGAGFLLLEVHNVSRL